MKDLQIDFHGSCDQSESKHRLGYMTREPHQVSASDLFKFKGVIGDVKEWVLRQKLAAEVDSN